VGQVNIADNTANDFLITGVQLEAGEQASGFEFMPIDTNLIRCQRYFQTTYNSSIIGNIGLIAVGTTFCVGNVAWKVSMRSTPTTTVRAGGSDSNGTARNSGTGSVVGTTLNLNNNVSTENAGFLANSGSVFTISSIYDFQYTASAEL
jgi:hypothetical protein